MRSADDVAAPMFATAAVAVGHGVGVSKLSHDEILYKTQYMRLQAVSAAIKYEPPPEDAAAGRDRCNVSIKRENV
ncbi:hypothetical protein OKW35_000076 [Paraburkholderia sp. MM5477-R1]